MKRFFVVSLFVLLLVICYQGTAISSCESVHQSNLSVCKSEYQPQCNQATTYANNYCSKPHKSVEDRNKCAKYIKIRDDKCRAMGNCRRQADAAFNTCKQQRAAQTPKKPKP